MVDTEKDKIAAVISDFEPRANGSTNGKSHANKALDLAHHLSEESAARKPSPLKEAHLYSQ